MTVFLIFALMKEKELFDKVSYKCSKAVTRAYSTSFSLAINFLDKELIRPIHSVYGFVRFADEIVDSFHNFNKPELLKRFSDETKLAIKDGISLNPILNSFQQTVNNYKIEQELIDVFLCSMEMDLEKKHHDRKSFDDYVLGSAEAVGLMCLRIFCKGDEELYQSLKHPAMKLGAAFQKVNFLRDMKADNQKLGRIYFPELQMENFNEQTKLQLESEIEADYSEGFAGIKGLPKERRFAVYMVYVYYYSLFKKIKNTPIAGVLNGRIRISNPRKYALLAGAYFRHSLNLI